MQNCKTPYSLFAVLVLDRPSAYNCTEFQYIKKKVMDTISVNKFRDNLKSIVEQSVSRHEPIKVTRRAGEAFVVMSAEDWEREQETLHVLQSKSLMQQIADSLETHARGQGYKPTDEQMNEIIDI